MGFSCGIVGLPNTGKSTLFNALTRAKVPAEKYPFSTIDPHRGVVAVPDSTLDTLAVIINPQEVIPTTLTFVDVAGLVRGASKGEGLGNMFLSHLREVDALIYIIRCFHSEDVSHPEGSVDPLRDIQILDLELIMADLDILQKRLEKIKKLWKLGEKEYKEEVELLERIKEVLEEKLCIGSLSLSAQEKGRLAHLPLLTIKPILYVANIGEERLGEKDKIQAELGFLLHRLNSALVILCARFEDELGDLTEEDQRYFLEEMGMSERGIKELITEGYRILNLVTFYTAANNILQAWTIPQGTRAVDAAGRIHSQIKKGFIKAEVVSSKELIKAGSLTAIKELGLWKYEGKDYIIQEGDLLYFRFQQ